MNSEEWVAKWDKEHANDELAKWYMKNSISLSDYYKDEDDELWSVMSPGFAEKCNYVPTKKSVKELYDDIDPDDHSGGSKAFEELADLAEEGYDETQYLYGLCHYTGRGIVQSDKEAVKWFRKAAKQGHETAQLRLGDCHYDGNGVRRSYKDSAKWYRMSAEQGNSKAQLNLGHQYMDGYGVEKSYEEAAKWFLLSAEREDPQPMAQCYLGILYDRGLGVEESRETADKWFALARKNGCNPEEHYDRNYGR